MDLVPVLRSDESTCSLVECPCDSFATRGRPFAVTLLYAGRAGKPRHGHIRSKLLMQASVDVLKHCQTARYSRGGLATWQIARRSLAILSTSGSRISTPRT